MASPRLFSRLALRIAAFVSSVVFLTNLFAIVLFPVTGPPVSLVVAVVVAVLAGAATYAAVFIVVARRIDLARGSFEDVRTRRFATLQSILPANRHDELDELIDQTYKTGHRLQQEIERLEHLENYRRDYIGDVSHELRTPIFAISGFAESLLDGALEDDAVRRRFVEKIEANAHRLDALTRDLAEISRIETGELKMEIGPFDLSTIIMDTTESLEAIAHEHQVELSVQLPPSVPKVVGDRERIRQVVANLVENAVKYNKPGGQVEVIVRLLPTGSVRIAVVDDGIGIPPEDIPRLTERFFRVDKSRSREQGGTGLGLAIVKHILEAHGQRLEIGSRANYGSVFSFELPAA